MLVLLAFLTTTRNSLTMFSRSLSEIYSAAIFPYYADKNQPEQKKMIFLPQLIFPSATIHKIENMIFDNSEGAKSVNKQDPTTCHAGLDPASRASTTGYQINVSPLQTHKPLW